MSAIASIGVRTPLATVQSQGTGWALPATIATGVTVTGGLLGKLTHVGVVPGLAVGALLGGLLGAAVLLGTSSCSSGGDGQADCGSSNG